MTSNHDKTLQLLGFTHDSIVETIMVTVNSDGTYNAAPMGVINRGGFIEARPFRSSRSYMNLHNGDEASINLTDDPMLFLGTAFKDEMAYVPEVNNWALRGCDATMLLSKLDEFDISSLQAVFKLKPIRIEITKESPTVFSRGRAMAIEAVIHATRVNVFQAEGNYGAVDELLNRIDSCIDVITRVSASNSPEVQVVEKLGELMRRWGVNR